MSLLVLHMLIYAKICKATYVSMQDGAEESLFGAEIAFTIFIANKLHRKHGQVIIVKYFLQGSIILYGLQHW